MKIIIFLLILLFTISCTVEKKNSEDTWQCANMDFEDFFSCREKQPYYKAYYRNPYAKEETVSIFRLMSVPEKFHDKNVFVSGFFGFDQGTKTRGYLYFSSEMMEKMDLFNAILIKFPINISDEEIINKIQELDKKYVLVGGKFYDRYGLFGGGLEIDAVSIMEIRGENKKVFFK